MKKIARIAVVFFFAVEAVFAGEIRHAECFARWDETSLTIGNKLFTRVWKVSDKRLSTVSFTAGEREWISPSARRRPAAVRLSVTASKGRRTVTGDEGLAVTADTGTGPVTYWVFPHAAGVLTVAAEEKGADPFTLVPRHLLVTSYDCMDMTDSHNELLQTREWLLHVNEGPITISGCALDIRDTFTGNGLVFLRLAPLPHARPVAAADFVVKSHGDTVVSLRNGYPVAELAYTGGEVGRIHALQAFQRSLRNYVPGRDGIFLSNTWGDNNRDARINETFLLEEVRAGAELGVDVIQIDDGWQKGKSKNSALIKSQKQGAWSDFRSFDPKFWDPDSTRFPRGLGPIVEAAKERGMGFGLWFGPDSSNDAAAWKLDADCLLNFWRTLGIRYFKIDSMKAHTPQALRNQRAMFDRMLKESNGDMVFDLDVTGNARRPGYFGMPDIGPLFVENRYTKDARYWPHQTLRNLWSLTRVIDPVRLRMELLNPLNRRDQYFESPLAPCHWRGDTLFAIVMFASPLGWFEISGLRPETRAEMAPLVARWKKERARLHGGLILPVGAKPDGLVWTGFASAASDGKGGYLVLFRELSENPSFTLDLRDILPGAAEAEVIGGRGTVSVRNGTLITVQVPEKLDYIWLKF